LRANGVEELVDIDLGLFPCPAGTMVGLFLELANDAGLQLSVTAPSAVVGIPHGMDRAIAVTSQAACNSYDSAVPGYPDVLMLPTFAASASVHVRGVGAVLKIIPTSCG
jgi:hypothetical protein